jgi:hypothetical protein
VELKYFTEKAGLGILVEEKAQLRLRFFFRMKEQAE